MPGIARTTLD
jgi:hypothetical protein